MCMWTEADEEDFGEYIIYSTLYITTNMNTHYFLDGLFRVDLIKPVSNVRPSTNGFFDFNEIWIVGRGRWLMHDGMQYDQIQGQGHEPFIFGNPAILAAISCAIYNGSWQLTTVS